MSTKDNSYEERLGKIKELSKKVSKDYKDSKISSEKFRWLMKNLHEAILQSKSDIVNKEDLIDKLEDLVCAVSEEEESNEQQ